MEHGHRIMKIAGIVAGVALIGCTAAMGMGKQRARRVVPLQAPHEGESVFRAKTHNGSIGIRGSDVDAYQVTATIETRAFSIEEADAFAGKVKVALVRDGDAMNVRIDHPRVPNGHSLTVNLEAVIPNSLHSVFKSHNGNVSVTGVRQTSGSTHNGPIRLQSIAGPVDVHSHNGAIRCEDASGPTRLRSHNGRVVAALADVESPECTIRTHNGKIDLHAPPDFAGRVTAKTHNGGIRSDFPVTVVGKINKHRLDGTVGSGTGVLDLEAHNGSISIRQSLEDR